LAIIVKKLLNIFAALPNCQSTGGVSIEMAKPIDLGGSVTNNSSIKEINQIHRVSIKEHLLNSKEKKSYE
jgi:hypothetical protein